MRVFVFEAYVQAGGTYMAYHLGRILRQSFGLEVIAVGTPPQVGMFQYPVSLPVVDHDTFIGTVMADDLLICNPSFSDRLFGLRLPCRKVSYVQGMRTFQVLDVFFDRYVFVSHFVQRFVTSFYGIDGPVIPAFIDTETFRPADTEPASRRRPVCVVLQRKHNAWVFERLCRTYEHLFGGEQVPIDMVPVLSQHSLADRLRQGRVFLGLDAMEGFGLPMLEAMACGCAVVGWDSGGCREYAESGRNSLLATYGDLEGLARLIRRVLVEDSVAERLSAAGIETGASFGWERFRTAWEGEFAALLPR